MATITESLMFKGLGYCIPSHKVTNTDLVARMNTSEQFIEERTGVLTRHHLSGTEGVSSLMIPACEQAISSAGLAALDIDALIVNTLSPDVHDPSQACLLQAKLGLRQVPAFDIRAQCSGFLYELELAQAMLLTGRYRNILVVCGEALSKRMDYSDDGRNLSILLGDGAAAAVVSVATGEGGLKDILLGSDGDCFDFLKTVKPGSAGNSFMEYDDLHQSKHQFRMQGKPMFIHASETLARIAEEILDRNSLGIDDIDHFICHQPNLRILDAVREKLSLPMSKFPVTVDQYGNMASASLPVTLAEHWPEISPGEKVLFLAYGSGATWGAALYEVQTS
ncbi:beta-ketoacyl-ACP synthase 3 [Zobellella sp. DQSA1]|uniref:beta-ketoacyl-ACP synthase 3 n=1 Tax=Zobellella sp. DQSA1 TaxID=3342386 RepID=UPI0035C0A211